MWWMYAEMVARRSGRGSQRSCLRDDGENEDSWKFANLK